MAIGNAVQRGGYVYVYDEKGNQIASISAGGAPPNGLKRYTSGTVNVQRGGWIYSYDEHGNQISSTST